MCAQPPLNVIANMFRLKIIYYNVSAKLGVIFSPYHLFFFPFLQVFDTIVTKMKTSQIFGCLVICVCFAIIHAGGQNDVLELCDLCSTSRNDLACAICEKVYQNNRDSPPPYDEIEKRGFRRQTRLFPCQCCAWSRHQNVYCCDQCYKKWTTNTLLIGMKTYRKAM